VGSQEAREEVSGGIAPVGDPSPATPARSRSAVLPSSTWPRRVTVSDAWGLTRLTFYAILTWQTYWYILA